MPVLADSVPGLPNQYYGTVTINGSSAPSGYKVTATISGVLSSIVVTVDSQGKYGYGTAFMLDGSTGSPIQFFVNGVQASQTATFKIGEITELNLTVSGNVPSTYTVPSSSTTSTITTSTTTPSTSNSSTTTTTTPSSSSSGTSSGSSGSSTTSSISTTSSSTTTAITSNVLGAIGSFSVSNGAVSMATSLSSGNGSLSISLAANTAVNLQGSQNLTVIQLATLPTPPAGSKTISAYACGPDNATFSPALTVTVKYDPNSLPADVPEANLYIALLQNNNWSELGSTVDTSAKTVSAPISHFSTYAVLGRTTSTTGTSATSATPSAVNAFSTSDLAVTPASVKAGELVTVSVSVVNGGTSEASKTVILKINDQDEAQKNVTVTPGASKVVSFNVSRSAPGNYKVSIDDQSDSFQVKGGSSGQSSDLSMPIMIIIGAGGLLVIILVIILVMRRRSE